MSTFVIPILVRIQLSVRLMVITHTNVYVKKDTQAHDVKMVSSFSKYSLKQFESIYKHLLSIHFRNWQVRFKPLPQWCQMHKCSCRFWMHLFSWLWREKMWNWYGIAQLYYQDLKIKKFNCNPSGHQIFNSFFFLCLWLLDVDECDPNPCINDGTCFDNVKSFQCQCKEGFTGPICDIGLEFSLSNLSSF